MMGFNYFNDDLGDFRVKKNKNFLITYYLDENRTKTSSV